MSAEICFLFANERKQMRKKNKKRENNDFEGKRIIYEKLTREPDRASFETCSFQWLRCGGGGGGAAAFILCPLRFLTCVSKSAIKFSLYM